MKQVCAAEQYLPLALMGKKHNGLFCLRDHQQNGPQVLDTAEIVEIVILTEVKPRCRRGLPEEDDHSICDRFHQGGPAADKLFLGISRPLSEGQCRQKEAQSRNQTQDFF